ncbi:MAG: nucleotide sugar dehydrogenase [Candidatus Caldarchaeum sp.]
MNSVTLIGAGYVGLPTAALLAKAGFEVLAVDKNPERVKAINSHSLSVEEDSINNLLRDPKVQGRLRAGHTVVPADIFFICVPTPIDPETCAPDLDAVEEASQKIAQVLKAGNLVIIESTLPVACTRTFIAPILEKSGLRSGKEFFLAYCPERVLMGDAIREITQNSRIIGGINPISAEKAGEVYQQFVHGDLFFVSDIEAEICKLAENAYRDVNIAFANELSALCEKTEVNPMRVIALANQHPRVHILNPGIGVGGHCIPVDPWFLVHTDPLNTMLIQYARKINDERPQRIAELLHQKVADIPDPLIAVSGLSYKPDCKDTRESPAKKIITILKSKGLRVVASDPLVQPDTYPGLAKLAEGADLLAILVEHQITRRELAEKKSIILQQMRTPRIIHFYAPEELQPEKPKTLSTSILR